MQDGGRRTEGGGRICGAGHGGLLADIGESVTNEANLCENASTLETHKIVRVTANSDEVLGLDNVETKPAGEVVLEEEAEVGMCGTEGPVARGGWADRDRRHWAGDQCHPEKCLLAEEDTGRDSCGTRRMDQSRSKTLGGGPVRPKRMPTRGRRHWAGFLWQTEDGPIAIEDTGRGTSATQKNAGSRKKTLGGTLVAHGEWADRDRRHWSGDQCHPEESLRAGEDAGRGTSGTRGCDARGRGRCSGDSGHTEDGPIGD